MCSRLNLSPPLVGKIVILYQIHVCFRLLPVRPGRVCRVGDRRRDDVYSLHLAHVYHVHGPLLHPQVPHEGTCLYFTLKYLMKVVSMFHSQILHEGTCPYFTLEHPIKVFVSFSLSITFLCFTLKCSMKVLLFIFHSQIPHEGTRLHFTLKYPTR